MARKIAVKRTRKRLRIRPAKLTTQHLYWHLLPSNRKLRYGDDRTVQVGEVLHATAHSWGYSDQSPPELCRHGMHACYYLLDCFRYSAGPIACRVRLGGRMAKGESKVAADTREVLEMVDVSIVAAAFALAATERAINRLPKSAKRTPFLRKLTKVLRDYGSQRISKPACQKQLDKLQKEKDKGDSYLRRFFSSVHGKSTERDLYYRLLTIADNLMHHGPNRNSNLMTAVKEVLHYCREDDYVRLNELFEEMVRHHFDLTDRQRRTKKYLGELFPSNY